MKNAEMLEKYFPAWSGLSPEQRTMLSGAAALRRVSAGSILHAGSADCIGLFVVSSGRLRIYVISENGREITLYRLYNRDICLFSASCIINGIQFDIFVEAESDTDILVIPADIYKELMEVSLPVSNFTNRLMASRFSDVMWLLDQILFKNFDSRLALFLIEQNGISGEEMVGGGGGRGGDDGDGSIHITHELIARNLGSAREVITKMLNYFKTEGIVELSRGSVKITDMGKLEKMANH